jgi:acetyl esterase/lipase
MLGSIAAAIGQPALAQQEAAPTGGARQIPARALPVPDTISDELKAFVGAPIPPNWNTIPKSSDEWKAFAAQAVDGLMPIIEDIKQKLKVTVEETTIAGVHAYRVTPETVSDANRNRLAVHFHGGGYVLYGGEFGAGEGMLMAALGKIPVVSVDYRMPPDFPFPAALDDAMAVWKALAANTDPNRMAVFGSSAGGGLSLALALRAKAEGVPLPAAIAAGTPWADLTNDGDSLEANAFVDNVLVGKDGWADAAGELYAGATDIRDPYISPIFGDFAGMPPTIITSGTRDLFLSDAVRVHRKLRQANVEAILQVFEAQSHAQFLMPFVPETDEAFAEITAFFDKHLAR